MNNYQENEYDTNGLEIDGLEFYTYPLAKNQEDFSDDYRVQANNTTGRNALSSVNC